MKPTYIIFLFLLACSSKETKDPLDYQPFSPSVIKVTFRTAPSDTVYISALTVNNIPSRDGSESETVGVSSSGDYFLSLVTDRPNTAFLKVNDERYNVIIFPNDTVGVEVLKSDSSVDLSFTGKGAEINNYYKEKKEHFGYADSRTPITKYFTPSNTYETLQEGARNLINTEMEFLKTYSKNHSLPSWFVQFEEAEIKYLGWGVVVQMPKYNEIFSLYKGEIPEDYYLFMPDGRINNEEAILSSHYFWFLDDYFITDLPAGEFADLSGFARFNKMNEHMLARSKEELSGTVKDLYQKYKFSSIIPFFTNRSSIDSLARVYEVTEYEDLLSTTGTRSKANTPGLNLSPGDTIPDFYVVNSLDSMETLSDYRNKVLYVNFWATWCGPCIKNFPQLNEMISLYNQEEQVVFLNICIDSDKDKWQAMVERYKLKGHNVMAEGKWNEKLRSTFNMKGIPNYVLINKNNILVENHTSNAPAVKPLIDQLIE